MRRRTLSMLVVAAALAGFVALRCRETPAAAEPRRPAASAPGVDPHERAPAIDPPSPAAGAPPAASWSAVTGRCVDARGEAIAGASVELVAASVDAVRVRAVFRTLPDGALEKLSVGPGAPAGFDPRDGRVGWSCWRSAADGSFAAAMELEERARLDVGVVLRYEDLANGVLLLRTIRGVVVRHGGITPLGDVVLGGTGAGDAGASLSGEVVTSDGLPVPGVPVRVYALTADPGAPPPLRLATDRFGRFRLEGLAGADSFRVLADRAAAAAAFATAFPQARGRVTRLEPESEIVRAAPGTHAFVRFVAQLGAAAELVDGLDLDVPSTEIDRCDWLVLGDRLEVLATGVQPIAATERVQPLRDAFEPLRAARALQLELLHPDGVRFCRLPCSLAATDPPRLRCTIPSILPWQRGVALSGAVADGEGRALEGVDVQVEITPSGNLGRVYRRARTDAEGRFAIRNLAPGAYRCVHLAPGTEAAWILAGQPCDAITLGAGGLDRGRVHSWAP